MADSELSACRECRIGRYNAGSFPPVKARRRKNAIVNLNAVSKAASRSGARRDGRPQRDFVSLRKSARHLLVRTPLLTQLRIAGTLQIKAETANQQAGYKTGWMPRCDFLRGIQIEGIKKRCGLAICNG